MINRQPPPLRTARSPSGHDIPIPESVFVALADIQATVIEQGQRTQAWQANHDSEHDKLGEKVATLGATKSADWAKVIGLVAGSLATIVTTIIAARPTLPAPEVRAVKTVLESRLDECRPMAPGTQERFACFERVYSEVEGARR